MNTRIKILRKELGLNQTEFGAKIGVKQGSIAGYENGSRTPLDTVINSICREFNVSETWLRTGEGDMFIHLSRDEEIAAFIGDVLSGEREDFRRRFISVLARLDVSDWKLLEKIANELANDTEEGKA